MRECICDVKVTATSSLKSAKRLPRPARPELAAKAPPLEAAKRALREEAALHAPQRTGLVVGKAARPSLVGVLGYLLHGLTFLTLAILALIYFGQVFWLLSAATGGLAAFSLYLGYTALRERRAISSERRS